MTLQATDSTIQNKELAIFMPGRAELKEFAQRLRGALSYRGADKLQDQELLALAAASKAHNLNPFLGEIWAIPGKGLMIGAKGWVKKLNEQSDERKYRWWPEYLEIRSHERETYGIPPAAKLAYVCILRRSDWLDSYITSLERLNKIQGMSYENLIELLGRPPVVQGVGFIGADETFQGTMSNGERCKKRAFAQACRQFVHLPFDAIAEGDVDNGRVMDSEVYEHPDINTVNELDYLNAIQDGTVEAPEPPVQEPVTTTVPTEGRGPNAKGNGGNEREPMTPDVLRGYIDNAIDKLINKVGETPLLDKDAAKKLAIQWKNISGLNTDARHAVSEFLFGSASCEGYTESMRDVCVAWLTKHPSIARAEAQLVLFWINAEAAQAQEQAEADAA